LRLHKRVGRDVFVLLERPTRGAAAGATGAGARTAGCARLFRKPGLFSVSGFDPETGAEYWIAFNPRNAAVHAASVVGANAETFEILFGACPACVSAPGSVMLDIPAFGSAVCRVQSSSPGMQSHP
jgi:hypothetical protein